jgi:hypothetical protein
MTKEKVLEVISIYRKHFKEKGFGTVNALNHDEFGYLGMIHMIYCHEMLDKMEKMVAEGQMEKVFCRLGFVQGCLWSLGIYTLEELKSHNRS